MRASDAHAPFLAAFREAEGRGLDIETTFPKLAQARTLAGAADPAAVLHGRVDRGLLQPARSGGPRTT